MAEMQLSDEQQQHIVALVSALAQDDALRERFQADVSAVFSEYGLGGLLPAGVHFEAKLNDAEVSGFALSKGGGSHIDQHIDFAHTDIPAFANFQIVPRMGLPG